jgi:hypothetical protein
VTRPDVSALAGHADTVAAALSREGGLVAIWDPTAAAALLDAAEAVQVAADVLHGAARTLTARTAALTPLRAPMEGAACA